MTIRYKCEECGAALNINDELAGTQGNCPRCQVQFTVPAPDSDAVPKPAVELGKRSGSPLGEGPLSDDDISTLLNSDAPPSAASERHVLEADSDDDAETEEDQQFDEEPRRERKKRPAVDAKVKSDSTESASIAHNLMGRGAQPVARDET